MKNIFTTLLSLTMLFFVASSFGQTMNVDDFHAVSISAGIEATLVQSSSPRVEYKMKKGDKKNLVIKVKNGTLHVKTKSNFGSWANSNSATVTIYYASLDDINISAGCTVKSQGTISAQNIDVDVSSGSTAVLDIEASEIDVDVSSGATLRLSGEANRGKFDATSGSTLNGSKFETNHANADANSGASLFIHVNESLDAEARSGASIQYRGNVKDKNIDAGWSGSITRKG